MTVTPIGLVSKEPIVAYSHLSRGNVFFRAPETLVERFADEAMPGCFDELAETKVFSTSVHSDVWSLGVCFLMILAKSRFFRVGTDRPFVSLRGAKRIRALEISGMPKKEIEREIETECVRWQSYRLFGIAAPVGRGVTPDEVNAGKARRKTSLSIMLGGAVKRGVFGGDITPYVDLLMAMLEPYAPNRCTVDFVLSHPVFEMSRAYTPVLPVPPSPIQQYAAIGGWTDKKDRATTAAMLAFYQTASVRHLPAEAAFVTYDCVARVVGGISAPEPELLMNVSAAAAAKVAVMLYDLAPSMAVIGRGVAPSWPEASQLEPYVVEYLDGVLRRERWLFAKIDSNPLFLVTVFHLMNSANETGRRFRQAYLTLDAAGFVRELPAMLSALPKTEIRQPAIKTVHDLIGAHQSALKTMP